ncbi:hypothetical protein DVR12_10805 [Chitinophaga silvatica]|uniref:Uncharacterized protein n=1 Tax=Chitinophaga silvatica TaxID=2282649 RepID=A0A3E1YCG8_9BACT|nr:hypothetical protein [Chitinophaga silvatica]RFS23494.1 hypothetical protein DVR12_10805 [Chitinophaga silvatica]
MKTLLIVSASFLCLSSLILASCKKDDAQDLQKIGGQTVQTSITHVGEGKPSPELGNTGDYYYDQTTGYMYGPKTGAGWTTLSLKGSRHKKPKDTNTPGNTGLTHAPHDR